MGTESGTPSYEILPGQQLPCPAARQTGLHYPSIGMRADDSTPPVQHIQSPCTRGVTGSCSMALPGVLNTVQGSANKCSEVLPQHSLAVLVILGIKLLDSLLT